MLRATDENLLFETDLSGPPSFFRIFSLLLKELNFILLFEGYYKLFILKFNVFFVYKYND